MLCFISLCDCFIKENKVRVINNLNHDQDVMEGMGGKYMKTLHCAHHPIWTPHNPLSASVILSLTEEWNCIMLQWKSVHCEAHHQETNQNMQPAYNWNFLSAWCTLTVIICITSESWGRFCDSWALQLHGELRLQTIFLLPNNSLNSVILGCPL